MIRILYNTLILLLIYVNVSAQKRSVSFSDIDLKETLTQLDQSEPFNLPGQSGLFSVKENALMDEELKNRYPEVKSYDLFDGEGQVVGSVVKSAKKLFYTIDSGKEMISFYPDHRKGGYILEKGTDKNWECETEELGKQILSSSRSNIGKYTYGDDLQSFRLAVITTGEFYEQHGNDDNVVLGEIVKTINGVNRIYERDMAVNFTLTGRVKLFDDKNTDPFNPSLNGGSGRTIQSARAFNDEFDVADYDLGITLNANSDGWPGGGVAVIQSVCDPQVSSNGPTKARIWATSAGESSNEFTVLVAHEFGHAFGARHTMNSDSDVCEDVISPDNAYEIGSGNTIMSYGGRCGEGDDYVQEAEVVNNYFHFSSLYVISQYIETLGCPQTIPTINTPPDLTINPCGVAAYQVPLNTPFTVSAEGSDSEDENLTYVWEQLDEDGAGSPTQGFLGEDAALSTVGPLFRGYAPSPNPTRDFPRFYNFFFQDPFESLPRVPRDLTLRCTVRDNNAEGGIFTSDEITVNVMDAGPLMIEIDSLIDTIVGGETINLTWNDDGISDLCDRVDVTLISLTDPNIVIPIASDVAYSEFGIEYFFAPGFSLEGDFHFKVECHVATCFSFYSYSRPFFSTTNCPSTELYFTCGLDDITANIGDESLNFPPAQSFRGVSQVSEDFVVNSSDTRASFVRYSLAEECESLVFPSGNPVTANFEYLNFRVAESGTYRIRNTGSDFGALFVFNEATFDPSEPCESLVGASVSESLNSPGTLTTSFREWIDLDLETCVEYRLGVATINADENFTVSISGAASISIESGSELNDTYYYVVEGEDGLIEAIMPDADFRSLRQGTKSVYTILVDEETFNPSAFIGKLLVDLGLEGVCVGRSANTTDLLLINPLPDDDMDGYHTDEDCDDSDPNVNPGQTEVLNNAIDENCDGLIEGEDNDMDGFILGIDCDDNNPAINPDAVEILNNEIDEDCDGVANVIDEDMDGFNSDVDCDDNNAAINPDAEEIANNDIDENCDGDVLVIDADMDGFNSSVDCDDNDASANPGAEEIPNNDVDENCDGEVLVIDEDMDGFNSSVDCNDQDASINPDATEIPDNPIDENCDGIVQNFDADMDGFNSEDDCDDSNPAINPNAEEIANNDIDENCDGVLLIIDEDGDGFNSAVDCNDLDSLINPGAVEIPNNDVDENCDGAVILIDEDMDGYNSTEDCDDMNAAINPGVEEIPNNEVDEDCDGVALVIDEDGDGFNSSVDCNDLDSLINPAAMEIPNNDVDENCNGELAYTDEDMDGYTGLIDCNDQDSLIYPGAPEIPNNGIDEDCDGADLTSSAEDLLLENIDLYPNPVTERLLVKVGNVQRRLTIRNMHGQDVFRSNVFSGELSVNFLDFPSGLYLAIIFNDKDEVLATSKVVKMD